MVPSVRYNGGVTTEELAGPFTLRIAVRASVDQVRQAWTTPVGLEAFFIRQAEGASGESYQAGDQYRWEWAPGIEDTGTVHRCDESAFEFGWYEDEGQVTVLWQEDGDETMVTLTEIMSRPTNAEVRASRQFGCAMGWTFFLANLKAWLEHGIDLRENNPNRTEVVNF